MCLNCRFTPLNTAVLALPVSGLCNTRPTVRPHSKVLLPYAGLVVCLMIGCEGVGTERSTILTLHPGFDKRLCAGGSNPLTGKQTSSVCLSV